MCTKERKKLARRIAREVLKQLGRMPAPEPAPSPAKRAKEQAAVILNAVREDYRTSARLAGWDAQTADTMLAAGISPAAAARAFSDALGAIQ
jgi:hypothetical protein